MITKVLLKVLDDCYESLRLALRFCLEDVAKDMFSKGLISESTTTSPNYDTVISEFKTGMKEKEDTPQLEKHCRLFLTCLSSQGGPAEAVGEDLAEQWKDEVQKELNISLSLDVVISDQDMKQMESELVDANTEMTEHITTNETEHLEGLDIHDHFNELLREFKHELHGKLSKGEEKLSNITDFVQQVVSTEDLCDVKDLDEVLKKLDCCYNFLDCQIIVLFAERFASPALLQKFENHSKEAKSFRRSHTIKILQNSFDVNFDSHQTNASISLHIAWGNVIIHGLYVLIDQFSVKHESHIVLKHITVTESSVHIEYLMRNSSMEIEEVIAHAQENISFVKFLWFIGIYECTINEHIILQVDNEENFTFELAVLSAARAGHNEAVQFLLDLTDNTDHCNEEALMLASDGGYEPVVKSLLLAGANVNIQDNDGWTALMKASKNNHITIIHTLLEVGANPHLQISDGVNALMIASINGHYQIVEQLLRKNVDCNCQQQKGTTALICASRHGHSNVVELLLNAQADPNIQDSDIGTALMIACFKGHFNVVKLLLNKKADPNIQDRDGYTALMSASSKGDIKVVEVLLNKNADANIQDSNGYTALMVASHHGYSQVVELLLKEADPNIQDRNGYTALMSASSKGDIKVVEVLLNKNADANIQDSNGYTALMVASHHGYSQVVELLLKEADPNIQDRDGYTALMSASSKGDIKVVEVLLNKNADANIQDSNGYTALMVASHHGYSQVVELLLKEEADPNIQNTDGHTALRFANQNGHFQTVELLLNHHANPNIQDMYGRTELHYAVLGSLNNKCGLLLKMMTGTVEDYIKIIQLLIHHSSIDIDAVGKGFTSLMLASMYGCTEVVKLLLEAGANPNLQNKSSLTLKDMIMSDSPDEMLQPRYKSFLLPNFSLWNEVSIYGGTPLIFASFKGYLDIVQILLQTKAKPDIQSKNGATAILLAARKGHYKIVQQLLDCGANPNISNRDGMTSLHVVILLSGIKQRDLKFDPIHSILCEVVDLANCEDYLKIIQLLIAQPSILVNESVGGYTSLHLASIYGCTDAVELLLQVGADPNVQTHRVETGNNNYLSLLPSNMLLQPQLKAFLLLNDFQTIIGLTALMYASENGHSEIVQLLLNAKAKPDLQTDSGETALYLAAKKGYPDIVQLLLEYGADPNISNRYGFTAIQATGYIASIAFGIAKGDIAAMKEGNPLGITSDTYEHHLKIMKLLIAQPNIKINETINGFTGLMSASRFGNAQIVELLLQAGADPNMSIKTPVGKHILGIYQYFVTEGPLVGNECIGRTALMIACECGHFEVVQLLLKANANPNLRETLGITALMIATNKGFSDIVLQLLEYDADPNICDSSGCTAIHHAARPSNLQSNPSQGDEDFTRTFKKLEIIQLLIKRGVNINIQNTAGITPLMMACSCSNSTQVVELLLRNEANPNIQTEYSETALMLACETCNLEVTKLLLKAKANPNQQRTDGITALMFVAQQGHPDIVQQLLEYGAELNTHDKNGCTAIHHIMLLDDTETLQSSEKMMSDKFEVLQLVITRGIDVNIKDGNGMTALMLASIVGFTEAVKLLLQAGADPNIEHHIPVNEVFITSSLPKTHRIRFTALIFACLQMNSEIVKLLLKANANPNQENALALMIAAEQGYLDIIQQLLKYGADPNSISNIDGNGMTALMLASIVGFTEAVKLLLQAGADPNIEHHIPVNEVFITSSLPKTHRIRFTALIFACLQMNSEIVKLLLKANANPNQENALALMIAAEQGYLDIIQQLLKYGADPNSISNIDGSTALHYVLQSLTESLHKDNKENTSIKLTIIQQLIEKGANINIQNEDGLTVLMMATDEGLSEIVELLLQNGADPNIHGDKGWTALMCACSHGNSKVAKNLLRYNANPQLVDNDGFTASIHALHSGNKGLAYELVNDRDFSQNELKCLLIMDLLEGDLIEAISRLDDITDLTTDKKELLISCVVGSLEDVISKLHESGVHPDTPLVGGLTLLMIASSCGYIELVEYLVIMEADVNQRDTFWKYTPLFYAILGSKSNKLVELLLENGADINAVAGNQTPLDMANSTPVENLMSSLLIKHGGQTFSELTSAKSEVVDMQQPIKKKFTIFAAFSDQVKSLIQDTVVKREHTEYTHT